MLTAMVRGGAYLDSVCLTLSSTFPKNTSSDESSTSKVSSVTPHESSKSLPSVIPAGFNPIYSYFGKLDHLEVAVRIDRAIDLASTDRMLLLPNSSTFVEKQYVYLCFGT
jgi:hypothetical protein